MSNKVNKTSKKKRNYKIASERFFRFPQKKKCIGSKNKLSSGLILVLLISLGAPLALVTASPGVHVQVPGSPLAPNQPVYIEFFTDPGEDGTIQLDITKPPLLAIFWQSGPISIAGGLLYDVTAPGFTDPGTYVVSASVTLAGGGGTIYGSTTFEVSGGGTPGGPPGGTPGFDYNLEVSPPVREVVKGEPAHYDVEVIYSNPSFSGTVVTVQISGLGPDMQWHMEPGGHLVITTSDATPPGHYTFDIVGEAQGVVRQTSATIIVREEEQPEEPPPEEHPEEHPPEEHPEEPPPEEHPEEHPPEPQEDHPPEEYYPDEGEQMRWPEEPEEPAGAMFLSNPLYLIIVALFVIIIVLIVVLRKPTSPKPQTSTKYCAKCGAPLKPGDAFCSSCGERV